jgi:hypothetical protein
MRILLDQVLRQTDGGLLLQAVPTPGKVNERGEPSVRVAERPVGVEGWRPIGIAPAHAAQSQVQPLPTQSQETWLPSMGAAPSDAALSNPPTSTEPPRKVTLEFRTPSSGGSASGDATSSEPADVSVRRPDRQPTDELTPEQLQSSEMLRRDESFEAIEPTTIVDDSFDDEFTNSTPAAESNLADGSEHAVEATDEPAESEPADKPATEAIRVAPPQAVVATPPPPLTRQLNSLRSRLRTVLKAYYRKSLNSQEHDPWEVMHGVLAYGIHSQVRQGGPRGGQITAVGWLCYNRPCKGKNLLYVTPEGELRAKHGVGLQGHMGQLLAMLAQSRVSPDYPIRVGDYEFKIQDLIEAEMKTCYPNSELTFKLIALSHYLDLDATWVNDQGMNWDFSRLINEELAQPIRGAACGGTHRLAGLSLAVKARRKSGAPLDGEYARAAEFIKNYQNYAFRLQNRDGSLSTKWFQGQGDESDIDRRIMTTGHILEWLIYSLSDEELRDQRTVRAVTYLTNLMYSNYDHEWEVGPISHATHALLLYDERVFQPFDPPGQTVISAGGGSQPVGSRNSSGRR